MASFKWAQTITDAFVLNNLARLVTVTELKLKFGPALGLTDADLAIVISYR